MKELFGYNNISMELLKTDGWLTGVGLFLTGGIFVISLTYEADTDDEEEEPASFEELPSDSSGSLTGKSSLLSYFFNLVYSIIF